MKLGYLARDQYGQDFHLTSNHPRKELLDYLGRKKASKMYIDTKDGKSKHIGYVIGSQWFTFYEVHEWSKPC